MLPCQSCESADVEYLGIADGGGDFGSATCDQYHCHECGADFEADCIDYDDNSDEGIEQ